MYVLAMRFLKLYLPDASVTALKPSMPSEADGIGFPVFASVTIPERFANLVICCWHVSLSLIDSLNNT